MNTCGRAVCPPAVQNADGGSRNVVDLPVESAQSPFRLAGEKKGGGGYFSNAMHDLCFNQ
jgi:hypothetical protein